MPNIVLVGLMASGKSTVAAMLADVLQTKMVDTDAMVEKFAGKSIADIFAASGEETFRDMESQMLAKATRMENTVIATGGGAMQREDNRNLVHDTFVVYLKAAPDVLVQRAAADATKRPLIEELDPKAQAQKLEKLLNARESHYFEVASMVIDTEGLTPESVAAKIAEEIQT